MPALTIQHSAESSSQCNKARKRNKMPPIRKGEINPPSAGCMTVEKGLPRNSLKTNKQTFKINEFGKAAGYQINTQK